MQFTNSATTFLQNSYKEKPILADRKYIQVEE